MEGGGDDDEGMGGDPYIRTNEDILVELIYSMVEPDMWESTGGSASVKMVNGVLVVKHRQSAVGEIESLLLDLMHQVESSVGFNKQAKARRATLKSATQSTSAESSEDENSEDGGLHEADSDPFAGE